MSNKHLQSYSLSDSDIRQILKGKTKVVSNTDLYKYSNIDQLLKPYDNFILLYESKPNYGHWVSVLRRGNIIEVNDPYGNAKVDEERNSYPLEWKIKSHQEFPYLRQLLLKAHKKGYRIEYNHFPLQELALNVNTCGRYAVSRIILKDLSLEEYAILLQSGVLGKTPDESVTNLTNLYL